MASPTSNDDVAKLEKEKLELEIKELKSRLERGALSRFERYIPLITAVVAVLGLFASVVQYTSTQMSERNKDIEKQIRAELEILLKHSRTDIPLSSQAVFALDNLHSLTAGRADKASEVTDILKKLIVYDFIDEKDASDTKVRLENLIIDYWPDYRDNLEDDPETNLRLIDRYYRMIEKEEFGSLLYDSLQGGLFRHGQRIVNSKLGPKDYKGLDVESRFKKINKHLNHYYFQEGRLLKKLDSETRKK